MYAGDGRHGEVLRYDMKEAFDDPNSWAAFDPGAHGVGNNPKGYCLGVFDGQYVYFALHRNKSQYHGEVLRYDTTTSTTPENLNDDSCVDWKDLKILADYWLWDQF